MTARVFVTMKPGVLDPQGETVCRALRSLGFEEAEDVRVGKYLEIQLSERDPARARDRVREMCERLLCNPVIEGYRFEIDEAT